MVSFVFFFVYLTKTIDTHIISIVLIFDDVYIVGVFVQRLRSIAPFHHVENEIRQHKNYMANE